ncbi:MAG: radical SAM protein [Myxococcota bacterium]|nr:radical SAM protein [Myxococcota bacterium]
MSQTPPRDPAEDIFEDLLSWAHGRPRAPHRLFAYLTERCNLRCPSCGLATGNVVPADDEMGDATVLSLADQAIELGVRECYLTGGEVLVRKPVVLDFMERIAAAGIRGVLSTNGTLLDRGELERLVRSGWHLYIVSLDGPTPPRNDPLRSRPGVFDQATQMIRSLVEARRRSGASNPEIHLHTVVSRANAADLTAMVQLCSDLGIDYFAAEPVVRQSEAGEALLLDDEARRILAAEVPRALARAADLGLSTNLGFLADPQIVAADSDTAGINAADADGLAGFPSTHCFVPFHNVVVHPDGSVSGCWQGRDANSPRLPDTTLAQAWRSLAPADLRAAMTAGQPPAFCGRCCLVNARDNRRFRALLLAELGDPARAEAALDVALAAEPGLDLLHRARRRLDARRGGAGRA